MWSMRVASDTLKRTQSNVGGSLYAPAPIRRPSLYVHAFKDGSEVTLCSRSVASLHVFPDLVFEYIDRDLWCRECGRIAEPEAFS